MRALRPYAFALLAIPLAVCVALVAPHLGLGRLERPLLLITIGGVVWYCGTGPGVLAVIAGTACIDFFSTLPVYRFAFERQDVISLALFAFFALVMGMFTAQRRNVEFEDFVFPHADHPLRATPT